LQTSTLPLGYPAALRAANIRRSIPVSTCSAISRFALSIPPSLLKNKLMKKLLTLLVLFVVATSAMAAPYRSVVVTAAGPTLTINVAAGNFIVIRNFTQEGGTVRGVVTAAITTTSSGGTTITTTANVLTAAMIDTTAAVTPETMNVVTIAGPVMITVAPVTAAQLFLTYRKESQPD
jgi:hypothetical protein